MISVHKICVLAKTPHWKSSIQRMFGPTACNRGLGDSVFNKSSRGALKISWALDIDDCLKEVADSPSTAGIIELTTSTLIRDCESVRKERQWSPLAGLFAVAPADAKCWLPLLRVSGFTDCWFSATQVRRLANQVERYNFWHATADESIESWLQENLPWRGTS